MNPQTDYLKSRLMEYLDRRSVPQHLVGKDKAQRDELSALLRAVKAQAPSDGYQEWWPRMEDAIDSIMRTRVWPVVNEVRAAAKLVGKDSRKGATVGRSLDPVAINADRVRRGEPVGDEWIFGVRAISLLDHNLTEDDLTPYRSGFYFNMVQTWGEDTAQVREIEYRRKHDSARDAAGLPPIFANGARVMIEQAEAI